MYSLRVTVEGFREGRLDVAQGDFGTTLRLVLEAVPAEATVFLALTLPDGALLDGGEVLLARVRGLEGTVALVPCGAG
jgi:hypothetical protein